MGTQRSRLVFAVEAICTVRIYHHSLPVSLFSSLLLAPFSHRVVPVIEMQRQESRDERETKRLQREEAEAAAEDAARAMAAKLAEKRRQREEAEATAKEIARVVAAAEEAARAMVEKQAEKSRQRERAMAAAEEAARAMAAEQAQQRRQHEEAEAAAAEEADAAHLCKPVNNECADETQHATTKTGLLADDKVGANAPSNCQQTQSPPQATTTHVSIL